MDVRRIAAFALAIAGLTLPATAGRPSIPARATGVLTLPGDHPWGVHHEPGFGWEWGKTQGHEQFRFFTGDDGHFVPYFPSHGGKPFTLRIHLPGKTWNESPNYQADRDSITAARALGVTGKAHLVEVEVNDGRGGQGTHFIITSLRVLDGTKEIPWRLEDRLGQLRKRFDQTTQANQPKLKTKLEAAKQKRKANPGGKILRKLDDSEIVVYRPTWYPTKKQLEVRFALKKQGGYWIKSKPRKRTRTRDVPPPAERGVSYSAGMAARYVVDTKGNVVEEEIFPPRVLAPSASSARMPWQTPAPTPIKKAPPGALRYYRTCGDAVCKDGGYRGPHADIPACKAQRQGVACKQPNEKCDLRNNCNMFLICTDQDPATRCAR